MRFSSIWLRSALAAAAAVALSGGPVQGQSLSGRYAALPHVPYWWEPGPLAGVEVIPLLWLNDVDGAGSGCCVIGAATRHRLGDAWLWGGLAFGTSGEGGQPAALELALELDRAALSYRKLHGRNGFAAAYRALEPANENQSAAGITLSAGSIWVDDSRYLEEVILLACPSGAPSAPCDPVPTPYAWSPGRDNAVGASLELGLTRTGGPRLSGRGDIGLELLGGDYDYLRLELEGTVDGGREAYDWELRFAGGWASGGAPEQRRFLLEGADPVTRWLNPYLAARGSALSDVPYFLPGGPHLRAYEETSPLVDGYVGVAGRLGRLVQPPGRFWGRVSVFADAAWTPGLPDRVGPDALTPGGDFLFDWTRLPDGQGSPRGEFRARVLEVPEVWADAGIAVTGGWERAFVTVSLPLWVSEPAFAADPIGDGDRSAFALRWVLTIGFFSGVGR